VCNYNITPSVKEIARVSFDWSKTQHISKALINAQEMRIEMSYISLL